MIIHDIASFMLLQIKITKCLIKIKNKLLII